MVARSHLVSRDPAGRWRALHAGQDIADGEAERGVERERPAVVRRLEQAYPGSPSVGGAAQDVEHQGSPDAAVLDVGVDADRADTDDRGAFIQEVAADDLAVDLGHHRVDLRVREHRGRHVEANLGRGEVRRESVRGGDRAEGVVTDPSADLGVVAAARPEFDVHHSLPFCRPGPMRRRARPGSPRSLDGSSLHLRRLLLSRRDRAGNAADGFRRAGADGRLPRPRVRPGAFPLRARRLLRPRGAGARHARPAGRGPRLARCGPCRAGRPELRLRRGQQLPARHARCRRGALPRAWRSSPTTSREPSSPH